MVPPNSRVAALAVVMVMLGGIPAWAQGEIVSWRVSGTTRQALVYAPATARSSASPLVLSFHGHGDDMENFQHTNIHTAWPEAVVVYFNGLPSSRDGYRGWQTEPGQDEDRDLALVDLAIATLSQRFRIDSTRIYATGFSNGANFTYLLWATRPHVFAAFGPVAARLRPTVALKRPKPVMHVGGLQDRQIRWNDQQAAIEGAKRANGVDATGHACGEGCTRFRSGDGNDVMTWVHQGGHEYPAATSKKLADFFRQHRLPTTTP
ncbi:MAG: PHB depolymerase family esterase [Vicinamibacterales bacterium]